MHNHFNKVISFCFIFFISISCYGQLNFESAPDAKGTLSRTENVLPFIKSFKVLSAAKATSMATTTEKIKDLIGACRVLNPPMGFDVKVDLSTSASSLKEKEPKGEILCYLRTLLRDKKTGTIKKSMDGADVYLLINAFDIFHQMGNYWQSCEDLHFPLFFEEPTFLDSTKDYFTISYKGDPLRIVPGNDQPLLIPLSRIEFLKFLIARMEKVLKDENEFLKSTQASKGTLDNLLKSAKETDKADIRSSMKTVEYNISTIKKNLLDEQSEINNCNAALKSLSSEDAQSPVRINYDVKSNSTRFGGLSQIVPPARKEGVALVKLNPKYYNYAASASSAQLIVMYYAWPKVGWEKDPNYVEKAALDIFNSIDYHALRLTMK